jgi:hypothetical protein
MASANTQFAMSPDYASGMLLGGFLLMLVGWMCSMLMSVEPSTGGDEIQEAMPTRGGGDAGGAAAAASH